MGNVLVARYSRYPALSLFCHQVQKFPPLIGQHMPNNHHAAITVLDV